MILNVVPAELAVVGNFDIIFHFLFAEPVATTNREGYSISPGRFFPFVLVST